MGKQREVQLWLNQEAGFLFESLSSPDSDGIIDCVGRKVEIEGVEFDMVSIEGNYYEIVGNIGGLDLIRATDDMAYVNQSWKTDRNIGRARQVFRDKTQKTLTDLLWRDLSTDAIERMLDIAVEDAFKGVCK